MPPGAAAGWGDGRLGRGRGGAGGDQLGLDRRIRPATPSARLGPGTIQTGAIQTGAIQTGAIEFGGFGTRCGWAGRFRPVGFRAAWTRSGLWLGLARTLTAALAGGPNHEVFPSTGTRTR
jgi:hypothetical protein